MKFNMLTRTQSDEDDDEHGNNSENSEEDEASLRVLETLWEAKMPTKWKAKIREDPLLQALLCKVWAESLSHFFKAPDVSRLSPSTGRSIILIMSSVGTHIKHTARCH